MLAHRALPAVKATDDARDAFVRDDAALIAALKEIDAGRGCVTDMRARYAPAAPKAKGAKP